MMFLVFVTLVSMLVAVVMSVVAWRMSREERRRSDARVAALAAEIHGDALEWSEPQPAGPVPDIPVAEPIATGSMFSTTTAEPQSRLALVAALGVLVVGTAATIGLLMSGSSHSPASAAHTATANAAAVPAAANPLPLELVALGHEREGDRLMVRGVVRNPRAGASVERLTAVVFLFNRDGGFIGSGRATVESPALSPGAESTFVVAVPGAADVGRYRVSFRRDDHVVPHVDRRTQTLAKG